MNWTQLQTGRRLQDGARAVSLAQHPRTHLVRWLLVGVLTAAGWLPVVGSAQEASDRPLPRGDAAAQVPVLEAQKVVAPLGLDGRLHEGSWGEASYRGFVQRQPVEGAPAVNDTEVWVAFDEEALYVGGVLHDALPETVARTMTRRDANFDGLTDYFELLLDPNLDRRTGYRFRVSAANVQADSYLYDDGEEDEVWDAVWQSAVRLHERGWTVQIRIPFSQIRYDSSKGEQTWGINFSRRRAADNEVTQFALESRLRPGRVSQFGLLRGLQPPRSGLRMEVRPYVVSSVRSGPAEPGDPFFSGRAAEFRTGLDLRYGLGSAFTLDATINPDFGQVEADPTIINLSESETFFADQRPFFVEDARIFDFTLDGRRNQLFYSRRIGRRPQLREPRDALFTDKPDATTILGAAKLTGRTARGLSVGVLGAVTAAERGRVQLAGLGAPERFLAEPAATQGVVRLRQDLREGETSLGMILTGLHRFLPTDWTPEILSRGAAAAGIDLEHAWRNRTWAVTGYLAGTHVYGDSTAMIRIQEHPTHYRQRPDLEWGAMDSTATSLSGLQWDVGVERRGGRWTGEVRVGQITSGFEANDLGFTASRERIQISGEIARQGVVPGRYLRAHTIALSTATSWSNALATNLFSLPEWRDSRYRSNLDLETKVTFLNYWGLETRMGYVPVAVSRGTTRGGPRTRDPGSLSWFVGLSTDSRKRVSLRPTVEAEHGREGIGSRLGAGLGLTFQPLPQLQLDFQPAFVRHTVGDQYVAITTAVPYEPTYGKRYLFADLELRSVSAEARMNLAFTPHTSLQIYAQPLLSAGQYVVIKQLERPETFNFRVFREGVFAPGPNGPGCSEGEICRAADGDRHVDFTGDGLSDFRFRDPDFNVRSLAATAVFRWEYRPGSTIFLVWQRRQNEELRIGDFQIGRDARALVRAPSTDAFILKVNIWLSL